MGRASSRPGQTAVFAIAVLTLVAVPTVLLLWNSFQVRGEGFGLGNYTDVLQDDKLLAAGLNSLWLSVVVLAGSAIIAVPLAWLVARTDMPLRGAFRAMAILAFTAPSVISAIGWIMLGGPRSGFINTWLEALPFPTPTIDILTPGGVAVVLILLCYPFIFLPAVAALEHADASLEHAAEAGGATRWEIFRRITLPLIRPAVMAGATLVVAASFIALGPVLVLGGAKGFETLPAAILRLTQSPPQLETAAVMAVPTLFLLAGLVWIQGKASGHGSIAIVGGRGARRSQISLGRWRWPALCLAALVPLLSLFLPFGALVVTSLRRALGLPLTVDNLTFPANYERVLQTSGVTQALTNSLWLAVAGALAALAIAMLAVWLVQRSRSPLRRAATPAMLAPLAMPGALLGIALVLTYARAPFNLGGTLAILLIAYVIMALPLSFQYLDSGLRQIRPELEEAARSVGASPSAALWRVTLPLLGGSIAAALLLNFVLLFRELDTSIFLYSGTNQVSAVLLYGLVDTANYQGMAALSVMLLAVNVIVVVVALLVMRRAKGGLG
jgi:iron(III) transport system permease protein